MTAMSPELSRACATVKHVLNLPPGPQLDELLDAASKAESVEDLPMWARNVIAYDETRGAK